MITLSGANENIASFEVLYRTAIENTLNRFNVYTLQEEHVLELRQIQRVFLINHIRFSESLFSHYIFM